MVDEKHDGHNILVRHILLHTDTLSLTNERRYPHADCAQERQKVAHGRYGQQSHPHTHTHTLTHERRASMREKKANPEMRMRAPSTAAAVIR